jgi:hypothetical protein
MKISCCLHTVHETTNYIDCIDFAYYTTTTHQLHSDVDVVEWHSVSLGMLLLYACSAFIRFQDQILAVRQANLIGFSWFS